VQCYDQSCVLDDLTRGSGRVGSENLQEHTGRVEKSQKKSQEFDVVRKRLFVGPLLTRGRV